MPVRFAVPAGFEPQSEAWGAVELERLAAALARRGTEALADVSLDRRLEVWSQTIAVFLDPESAERRALFPGLLETSGLSAEGLCEGLEIVLEGAAERPARALAATLPPPRRRGLAGVVLAGNIPGLAVQSVLPALLLGRPLLLKSASAEPLFAPALLAALAAREPGLGQGFAAVMFDGGKPDLVASAFASTDRLLAYGGGDAISSLTARFGNRLVACGPKASVALVGTGIDAVLVARKLARDIALFDQRGCLSVQAVYTTYPAGELADALEWALAIEHRRLPPGPIPPSTAALVQQLRGAAALRARRLPELPIAAGTVLIEPEPRFTPSPGLRTVCVHPLGELRQALAALEPWKGRIQGSALAGDEAWALAPELEACGVSRLAAAGELQAVDAGWHNGGLDPMALFA